MPARSRQLHKRIDVLAVLVLLLGVGLFGGKAYRLWHHLSLARQHLRALDGMVPEEESKLEGLVTLDLQAVSGELSGMREDLEALQTELGPFLPLSPKLGWLPYLGGDVAAAPHLLEIGVRVSSAGEMAFDGLAPVAELALHEGTRSADSAALLQEALPLLVAAQPQLAEAQRQLEVVPALRAEVDASHLSPRVARWVEQLDRYWPLVNSAVEVAQALPELLGASSPRSYLILAQNEDERRATGGYITEAGLLTIDHGKIVALDFKDSYAIDDFSKPYPDPPAPLLEYMLAEIWVFRDANWSPDFPTTAKAAADLYELGQGVRVDGVIAVDQKALQLLLKALGPLQLEEYGETVDAQNVIGKIRAYWAPAEGQGMTSEWWRHRKDFMGVLLQAMLTKLEGDVDSFDPLVLVTEARQALEEKHILICVKDPQTAAILSDLYWDGAIRPVEGDYLFVVDANVGWNKANARIQESIRYTVDMDSEGRLHSVLDLTYQHRSTQKIEDCRQEIRYDPIYEQMMDRCYWGYLRLYVPQGSRLLQATRTPVPASHLLSGRGTSGEPVIEPLEAGKAVFATFFELAPAERKEIHFEYGPPLQVVRREADGYRYELLIQKQPGTDATPVEVNVSLPQGAEVVSSEPDPVNVEEARIRYTFDLSTDQKLVLTFRSAEAKSP
jgi:hypothetical protein